MSGIAIVGGGPGGAATAIALARVGRRPMLLERDVVPGEKVCGEFLGEDAAAALRELGLDVAALGAVPISRALFGAGRWRAELRLPFAAWGLPRATLDAALQEAAGAAGGELHSGVAVRAAEAIPTGWRLRLADGSVVEAGELVLATGKHELRGLARAAQGGAIGVKLPLRGTAPEEAVALLACGGGYAGLQPRPGGGANLCAALDPLAPSVTEVARSGERFIAHVAAGSDVAAELLSRLEPASARPMTVAGVPYGFVHRGGGPFRVGDQAAVIPSFCGDGVAMALASALAAAAAIGERQRAAHHHDAWAGRVAGGMRLAGLFAAAGRRAPRALVAGVGLAPGFAAWAAGATRLGWRCPRGTARASGCGSRA